MAITNQPVSSPASLEIEPSDELYEQRSLLAFTADALRKGSGKLRTAESFIAAFAIVGEDIADNALRTYLQAFFIGESGVSIPRQSTSKLYNGGSRRSFSGLPTARQIPARNKLAGICKTPPAILLVRNLAAYEPRSMTLAEQESHAGDLIRALSLVIIRPPDSHPPFKRQEAATATAMLLPTLAADLCVSLEAVWTESSGELCPNRLTI